MGVAGPTTRGTPPAATRRVSRANRWRGAAAIVPLVAGLAAYVSVLAWKLPAFTGRLVPNSDTVSPGLLAQALAQPGHGAVYLGLHPAYTDLLLATAASHLGGSHAAYEILPYAVYLVGVVILALTVRLVAGWTAALLGAALAVAATPLVLYNLVSPGGRVTTLLNMALLGLLLVLLARGRQTGGRRAAALGVAAVALGVLSGLDTASDPLLALVGMVPFVAAALLLAVRRRGRPALLTAATAVALGVVAVAAYALTSVIAHPLHLVVTALPLRPATPAGVVSNLGILGGDAIGAVGPLLRFTVTPSTTALQVGAGAAVSALVVLAAAACGWAALRPGAAPGDRGRGAHALFWSLAGLLDLAVFLGTNAPDNPSAMRYLTPLWLSLAALAPLLLRRPVPVRVAVLVAAGVLAAVNAWGLAAPGQWSRMEGIYGSRTGTLTAPLHVDAVQPVIAALERSGVSRGYADYWDANLITWETSGRVTIRQVSPCGADGRRLCPDLINAAASWFRPVPGPVAVIVDPRYSVTQPPSATYGPPQRVMRAGSMTIYVYADGLSLTPGDGG